MKVLVNFFFMCLKRLLRLKQSVAVDACMQYKIVEFGLFFSYKAQEKAVFLLKAFFFSAF